VGAYLTTLRTGIRAAILAAWPACGDGGIYTTLQVARLTLDAKAVAGTLPFAAFEYVAQTSEQYGLTNRVVDGTLTVYYVATDDTSPDELLAQLETLRDYLHDNGIAGGQVVGHPWVSDSLDLPLNRYFFNTARPFISGAVLVRVIAGEQAP
jgi:hypothetical protein